jgi:alpha-tubulin suppressor-like RCC1 family protein
MKIIQRKEEIVMKSVIFSRNLLRLSSLAMLFLVTGCIPQRQLNLSFAEVSAGYSHSMGLTKDGKAYIWGSLFGEYDLDQKPVKRPQELVFPNLPSYETIVDIDAGMQQALALASNGTVFSWGLGATGDGYNSRHYEPSPIEFPNLHQGERVFKVRTNHYQSAAITNEGRLYIWGQFYPWVDLEDVILAPELFPLDDLAANESIVDVSLGGEHTLALTSAGRVFAWGNNADGRLGIGTLDTKKSSVPLEITFPGLPESETIQYIATGAYHSLAATDSCVYSWGNNAVGELGDGTNITRTSPTKVTFPVEEGTTLIENVSCNQYFSLAITNHKVYAWGSNYNGQLGNGTKTDGLSPLEVSFFNDIYLEQISAGAGGFVLANDSDGLRGYAWGNNHYGTLGDGTVKERLTPVLIY